MLRRFRWLLAGVSLAVAACIRTPEPGCEETEQEVDTCDEATRPCRASRSAGHPDVFCEELPSCEDVDDGVACDSTGSDEP